MKNYYQRKKQELREEAMKKLNSQIDKINSFIDSNVNEIKE